MRGGEGKTAPPGMGIINMLYLSETTARIFDFVSYMFLFWVVFNACLFWFAGIFNKFK
jgi:hypothetical protein